MANTPDVAILLATYNGEKYLEQQLESIFAQTYESFKVYVSDDNSTDATLNILKKFQRQYPDNLFYSVNQKNIGFVKNFEQLLQGCQSTYIAFSDQDDFWEKDKLRIEVDMMQKLEATNKNRPCLVHSDLSIIDANGKILSTSYFDYRNYHIKEKKDLGHILGPSGIMGNTLLINTELRTLVLPFPKELDVHDYWIGINCELFGHRKTVFQPLVQYRIHSTNSSNSQQKLTSKKISFSRDIKLPNLETNRKYFLPQLQKKVSDKKDMQVFNAYLDYLLLKKNPFIIYLNLLRYSLVKRNIFFRVKLFFKIVVTNRY